MARGAFDPQAWSHRHAFFVPNASGLKRPFTTRSFLTHIKDFRTPETYSAAMTLLVSSGAFAWTLH